MDSKAASICRFTPAETEKSLSKSHSSSCSWAKIAFSSSLYGLSLAFSFSSAIRFWTLALCLCLIFSYAGIDSRLHSGNSAIRFSTFFPVFSQSAFRIIRVIFESSSGLWATIPSQLRPSSDIAFSREGVIFGCTILL